MFNQLLPSLRRKHQEQSKREPDVFDFFEEFVRAPFGGALLQENRVPNLDVSETEQELLIKADVPGMDKKDIQLTLENNALIIRAKTESEREEKKDNYIHRERKSGSIYRSVPLPDYIDAESATASCDKGVLTIRMHKLPEKMPKRIAVE